MRIAFVSVDAPAHGRTAANERLWSVVDLFAERGHDVHCLCGRFWDGRSLTHEADGVSYHAISIDETSRGGFFARLPFVLRSLSPDVIHASADPAEGVLAAAAGSMMARAPLLAEYYGDEARRNGVLSKLTSRRPDAVFAPSRLVATELREVGGADLDVGVVPDPIDFDRIRSVDPSDGSEVVYARHLDERANLESLFLALAEHRRDGWSARVIGDGPERERYERLARDLRIADSVEFTGDASREERIAAYRGAHVFVQTAERCRFPNELTWALASGCVGIVEYHVDSSAHELIEGRQRGFRTTCEEELADAIEAARDLEHRDVDDRFEAYDRTAVIERYLSEYRSLMDGYGLL